MKTQCNSVRMGKPNEREQHRPLYCRFEHDPLSSKRLWESPHPAGVRGVGNLPLTSAFVGPMSPVLTSTLTMISRTYAKTLLARKARLGVVVVVSLSILGLSTLRVYEGRVPSGR